MSGVTLDLFHEFIDIGDAGGIDELLNCIVAGLGAHRLEVSFGRDLVNNCTQLVHKPN